jgi:hypothetical protein
MVERKPGYIKRHTPKGRYEEYRAKHAHLIAQTQGEARYLFEKKLDTDARRYARNSVARDVLTAAVLATGAVYIGREIKNQTLGATLRSTPRKINELSESIKAAGRTKASMALEYAGSHLAEGAAIRIESHLPVMMEIIEREAPAIGRAAASGALQEVHQSLPAITHTLEERLTASGDVIAARIMAAIESGMPHMAKTFAASVRSIPGMLLFGTGKK